MLISRGLAFVGVAALLIGCADVGTVRPSLPAPRASTPIQTPPLPTTAPPAIDLPCTQTSHGCIALNPDVTENTIAQTICVVGYTATVRPSTTYTNGVKSKLVREAGLDASHMADYELDHVIPLAVGGHPRKLSNLQLQPWSGENSATAKDGLERRLQRMVCEGQVTLADAQYCIAENWQACAAEIGEGRAVTGGNFVTQSEPSAAVDPPQQDCVIKGNVSKNGKIYHVPGSSSYEQTQIDEARGERWFCTEEEARAAGWRPAYH